MTIVDLGMGLMQAILTCLMTVLAFSEAKNTNNTLYIVLALDVSILIFSSKVSLLLLTVDRYMSVVHALRYPSVFYTGKSLSGTGILNKKKHTKMIFFAIEHSGVIGQVLHIFTVTTALFIVL